MTLGDAIEEALDDLLGPKSDIDHECLAVELADTARRWFAEQDGSA